MPVESSAASHRPNGIVQTRTNDAGESEVALLVAPKGPDGIPVPLEHMRGVSLFPESRETRERSLPGYDQTFQGGGLYRYRFNWILRDYSTNFGTGALKVSSTLPGASDLPPVPCYTSDGYIGYKFYLGGEKQHRITFSNGTFTGVVDLEIRDDYKIYARFNETGIFQAVNDNLGWVSVYLPLQAGPFSGMDYETTSLYTGLWTATVDPVAASGDGTVLTPTLEFELRGLSFESVTFAKKPDDENGNTTGGTFQGRANFFREGAADSGESGTLFWRAAILQKEAGESEYSVIRDRIYGSVPGYSGGAVDISGEWDGKNNFGQNLSGEHEYAVILRAVLETELDVTEGASADGYIATPGGFSSLGLTPRIDIFPNPYMPFDDSNVVYDEFGEPQWPGYNYTDELDAPVPGEDFPDYDNDGVPDWEPFQENIKFSTFLRRPGYSVGNWTLTVKNEEGSETLFTEEGTGESVSVEWKNPPADLEPQMLQVELQFQRCLDQTAETGYQNQTILARGSGVRAQDGGPTPGQCVVESFVAELAYNLILELKEVQFGDTPLAERGDNGPYLVYDYINNEAPNEVAQWKKSDDKMVPVVMKMGSTVHAQARFLGTFSEGDSGVGVKVEEVRATIDLNGVSQIKLAELSQLNIPMVGNVTLATVPIELPNEIGRHKARITWDVQISDSAGSQSDSFVTPKDGSHMLYTVIGQQPTATQNTGSSPEESYLWYHPVHFRDAEVTSNATYDKPPTRSPLDMAVEWSKGEVGSESEVLARLASNIFEKSGYVYFGDTNKSIIRSSGIDFYYYDVLQEKNLECADASDILKIFANYLGLSARIRRFEADVSLNTPLADRDFLFTNYITLIGQEPDEPFSIEPPSYYLPLTITGTRRNFVQTYGTGNVKDSSGQIRSMDWVQYRFIMHQVVDLDGEVADCSARFEEVGPRDWYVNPDLIINQRSMPRPAAFAVTVKRLLPGYNLPQRIIDNSSPSFSENFTPVELKQEALTVDEYLDRFLYAWITPPSVRKPTGYNLEDFSSSSTLYDKLEFKR